MAHKDSYASDTPAAQPLSADELVLAVGDIVLDVNAGGREPWGPEREPWGDPPLSDEVVHRIVQRARYFRRLYHGRISAANAGRLFDLLVEDIELLAADHDAYDVVEAGTPPLDHPDGGRRAD